MGFNPVMQWCRLVAAWNGQDWEAVAALLADDFVQVAAVGKVHDPEAKSYSKESQTALIRRWSETRGLSHSTRSLAGHGNSIATTYEESFADGTSWTGCMIGRFDDSGQLSELYSSVPA